MIFNKFFSVEEYSSVQHQKPHSSTQPSKFHTKNPSVQHTPLSSTPKSPQFHTKNPSVPHQRWVTVKLAYKELFWCGTEEVCWTEGFFELNWGGMLNWGVLVWNWGVLVWNWGILGAEKEWPFCLELMCWTEGDVELRGPVLNFRNT